MKTYSELQQENADLLKMVEGLKAQLTSTLESLIDGTAQPRFRRMTEADAADLKRGTSVRFNGQTGSFVEQSDLWSDRVEVDLHDGWGARTVAIGCVEVPDN